MYSGIEMMMNKAGNDFYQGCRARAIMLALEEDRYTGDITTLATIDPGKGGSAVIRAKDDGVLGGVDVALQIFAACDPKLSVVLHRCDGEAVFCGEMILEVMGKLAPLLIGERTVLNFMQRMSGIATRTRVLTHEKPRQACAISIRRRSGLVVGKTTVSACST
jgi:nicotinate-nucleotide pyrophosphorylase (carboxylating)